jgi:glycerol-3-phosphate acyltransferase PlsY
VRTGNLLAAAAGGYLLGTIPSADIASRLASARSGVQTDLRNEGSRNPGAANAIKVLGRKAGAMVLAADIAKGAAAGAYGRSVGGAEGAHLAGVSAVIGHCFPLWSGFRGGKGVATCVGQSLATFPAYTPIGMSVAGAAALGQRRSRAHTTAVVMASAWTAAALLWWWRRWPNLWGPAPSVLLPLATATSSAIGLSRFAAAERDAENQREAGGPASSPTAEAAQPARSGPARSMSMRIMTLLSRSMAAR